MITRTVYLIVYNSPLFPVHWGLWIPSLHNPAIGKFLNAEGDAANGFEIIFQRNHTLDADATSRPRQCLPLAEVADCHVLDVDGDGGEGADSTARDELERVLLSVPAPGKSLLQVSENGSKVRHFTFRSFLLRVKF
jgi:hypothetical protein